MDRIHDILNSVNETLANAAQKTYKGQKRSELKDSDFLFPETRSFPIVSPQDVPDAISNYGRMKGQMSYDAFLKKLYNMAKRKGPEFVAALPEASKKQLNIKSKAEENENETPEMELEEYKSDFYEMSLGSIKAIASHAQAILDSIESESVKEGLTEPFLQGKIAITEDYMRMIHDYLMFSEPDDDNETEAKKKKDKKMPPFAPPIGPSEPSVPSGPTAPAIPAAKKPGLWDNIRKKKEREGKNYKPAKRGDKDRPDPEQWKKLT